MLTTALVACLIRGRNCMNTAGSGEGRPSFGSRACRCRIAAPALAASIACVAIWSGVIGSASDMVGVWIEPVTAQVMTTLFASWGMDALFSFSSRASGTTQNSIFGPRLLEMLHHLGTQRGLLLGGPCAETFAGFEAELVRRDQFFKIRRWPRPALDVGQHGLVDRQREVGPHEVSVFERAEHREPAAESCLDH